MEVAKKHQDQLERIKKRVKESYDYFKPNYDRYNEFRRFVFESSLTADEIALLATIGKPQLEFNILEAYISRLLGEFSKQEPDIEVSADDQNTADPIVIRIIEQHLRHTLCDADNHHTRYEVYKDLLSGGFSVFKISTEYAHPMSMKQVIKIDRAYDPTLCGFDQLARYSHKGDGRFCFELFPMSKQDFEETYPGIDLSNVNFTRDFAGFNWSFSSGNTHMLMVCDFYEKKKKKVKIVELRTGETMTMAKYEEMVKNWQEMTVPPTIVGKPRMTEIETICRYRVIDNQVLEYVETDFTHFPLIFVDGHSVMIRTNKNGSVRQVTRPYVYHAKGSQRLKNYAGISLANEIENTIQHKFIIKKEALPKEGPLLDAITDIQKQSNIVVNAFYEEKPDQPIPDPIREVNRVPAPPEIVNAFSGSDSTIQNILGSYDASLGINNNQLSGIAIVEAATQSNAAAMPYVVGFMQGLQRVAQIYVDLFPKYVTTPTTIPIMDEEGKKSFIKINQNNGVNMFYDANALNVIVKAGASFQVQKSRTIMMIKEMMGMSPLFAQFISEKGLNFVLDNMEGKGIDQLKRMVDIWTQEMEQQKQMAMQSQQQEMQNNPAVMRAQNERIKLQQNQMKMATDTQLDVAKLKAAEDKLLADIQMGKDTNLVQIIKADTERFAKKVELALAGQDQRHRHFKEAIETHHKINQPST